MSQVAFEEMACSVRGRFLLVSKKGEAGGDCRAHSQGTGEGVAVGGAEAVLTLSISGV